MNSNLAPHGISATKFHLSGQRLELYSKFAKLDIRGQNWQSGFSRWQNQQRITCIRPRKVMRTLPPIDNIGYDSRHIPTYLSINSSFVLGEESGMGQNTFEFSDDNFQSEVIDSTEGVLVDFWAPWCGPCRQIAPLVDQLAEQYAGSVKVGKLNIDDNPGITNQYGIQSIPTLLLFKGGEVVERFVGMPPKSKLEQALSEI